MFGDLIRECDYVAGYLCQTYLHEPVEVDALSSPARINCTGGIVLLHDTFLTDIPSEFPQIGFQICRLTSWSPLPQLGERRVH